MRGAMNSAVAVPSCETGKHVLYFPCMGWYEECKKTVGTAKEQLTSTSPKPKDISFTPNFQKKAHEWGLSEKDALDVYYHGEERKTNMRVRKYNGYELGIYYGHNTLTGQVYISTIWEQGRR